MKNPEPNSFKIESYKILKEELISALPKLFQKMKEERTLPNLFYNTELP